MLRSNWLLTSVASLGLGALMATSAAAAVGTDPVYINFGTGDNDGNGYPGLLGGAPAPYDSYVWSNAWPISHVIGNTQGLVDYLGNSTGSTVTITDTFNFVNWGGAGTGGLPGPVGDAAEFWQGANTSVYIQSPSDAVGIFEISGLDVNTPYNLTFFASRSGATDSRTSKFRVVGADVNTSADLNASSNNSQVVSVNNVLPDQDGKFTITLQFGSVGAGTFAYLNAMKIVAVPEPASLGALSLGGLLLLRRRRGSEV
jgi:hypothetical protein